MSTEGSQETWPVIEHRAQKAVKRHGLLLSTEDRSQSRDMACWPASVGTPEERRAAPLRVILSTVQFLFWGKVAGGVGGLHGDGLTEGEPVASWGVLLCRALRGQWRCSALPSSRHSLPRACVAVSCERSACHASQGCQLQ
jgi:hypothetical protein